MALWSKTSTAVSTGYGITPTMARRMHPEFTDSPPYAFKPAVDKNMFLFNHSAVNGGKSMIGDNYRDPLQYAGLPEDPLKRFRLGGNPSTHTPAAYRNSVDNMPLFLRKSLGEINDWGPEKRKKAMEALERFKLNHPIPAARGGKRLKGGSNRPLVKIKGSGMELDLGSIISGLGSVAMNVIATLAKRMGESVVRLLSNPRELISRLSVFAPAIVKRVRAFFRKKLGSDTMDRIETGINTTVEETKNVLRWLKQNDPEGYERMKQKIMGNEKPASSSYLSSSSKTPQEDEAAKIKKRKEIEFNMFG